MGFFFNFPSSPRHDDAQALNRSADGYCRSAGNLKLDETTMDRIETLLGIISRRRSVRSYREDMPVSDEKIRICIEAARLAPSACNRQPWRFIIVKDPALRSEIAGGCLLPGLGMQWAGKAPVIVVLCAALDFVTHKAAPMVSGVQYWLVDAGIAGEHFVLAAEAQGLGTCWIGWFKEKSIKKLLGIPRSVKVVSLITLGYPAEVRDAKARLQYEQIAFAEKWDDSPK